MTTGQTIQADIDAGIAFLSATTDSGSHFIKAHGKDWTKWPPNTNWYKGYSKLYDARKEAGTLDVTPPVADFTFK